VASGVTIANSYREAHWEDSSKSANYVDVKWEISIKTEDRLTIEELQAEFPLIPWNHLLGSGVMPGDEKFADKPPRSTQRLISVWDEHLRNLGMSRPKPEEEAAISLDLDAEAVDRALDKSLRDGNALIHGEAPRFILLTEDVELDALAVYVVAHNSSYPNDPITYGEVEASSVEVVRSLRALGFYVADDAADVDEDAPLGRDPEAYVRAARKLTGSLNMSVTAMKRREQSLLRGALGLHSALSAQCGICSKTYPVKFLVAGHIKKRSECSKEEQMDVLNIAMPVCIFGCDALFEHRYITVKEGRISVSLTGSEAADLYLHALEGQTAPGYTTSRAEYFSWHASQPLQK
jgi:hypothetical protein